MNKTISKTELEHILLEKKKTIFEIIEYFANRYYIYGKSRSGFEADWTSELRFAINTDSFYFSNPTFKETDMTFRGLNERPRQGRYFFTKQVLNDMFDTISEISTYVVTEREIIDAVCKIVEGAWELKQKNQFKSALAGNHAIITRW